MSSSGEGFGRPESPCGVRPSGVTGQPAPISDEGIVYAIGDIHGRLDLLKLAADAIMDDLAGRSGRVICLGDYVDRGPDSKGVIEFLMGAQRDGAMTCLKGNHEDMLVDSCMHGRDEGMWLGNGGMATIASYGGEIDPDHVAWMASLPTIVEAAGRVFVHAGLMPGAPLEGQEDDVVMWIRDRFLLAERDFIGWPHIVHGHTPSHPWKTDPAEPELLAWRTNLDTAAFHTGVLTVGVFEGDGGPPARVLRISLPAERRLDDQLASEGSSAARQLRDEKQSLPNQQGEVR